MAYPSTFLVSDVYAAMPDYFSGRSIPAARCYENIRKVALELSENYEFPLLQGFGPTVPLTVGQNSYNYSYFQNPVDAGLEINQFDSFFIYYNGPPVPLSGGGAAQNAGFPLRYKTIKDIEILTNILGLPTNWTRHEGLIYLAMCPDQIYYMYLRYQKEHPFPNAGLSTAGQDQLLFPNSWQDIIEIATAERTASDFDLNDRAAKFHQQLYGDPEFEASAGDRGRPGLIFGRTSQKQRDQTTTTKSARLMMRPIMR